MIRRVFDDSGRITDNEQSRWAAGADAPVVTVGERSLE
jgi:hypothetical protein